MWANSDKTPGHPTTGPGGDSNNNDDVKPAADLTPPRQIPKHPICTTRPPSVMRHPNGYYITTFDRRSFITDAPSTSTSSAGGSTASAAVRYFKKATPDPAASKSKSACLMMKPVPKVSCNPEAEAVVLRFLQQYIQLYDGDMREQLLDAYHEDAVMSMSVAYPCNFSKAYPYDNQEVRACNNLKRYLSVGSRNLLRVRKLGDNRDRLLHQGRLKIVGFLDDLPKTQHFMDSFTLDVTLATAHLMTFTVTGLFRERAVPEQPIRHFNRMFVVVPRGSGFCIVNEMLHVTLPTLPDEQRALSPVSSS